MAAKKQTPLFVIGMALLVTGIVLSVNAGPIEGTTTGQVMKWGGIALILISAFINAVFLFNAFKKI